MTNLDKSPIEMLSLLPFILFELNCVINILRDNEYSINDKTINIKENNNKC